MTATKKALGFPQERHDGEAAGCGPADRKVTITKDRVLEGSMQHDTYRPELRVATATYSLLLRIYVLLLCISKLLYPQIHFL